MRRRREKSIIKIGFSPLRIRMTFLSGKARERARCEWKDTRNQKYAYVHSHIFFIWKWTRKKICNTYIVIKITRTAGMASLPRNFFFLSPRKKFTFSSSSSEQLKSSDTHTVCITIIFDFFTAHIEWNRRRKWRRERKEKIVCELSELHKIDESSQSVTYIVRKV